MANLGPYGAGLGAGVHADVHLNAHAGLGIGPGFGPYYGGYGYGGYSSTGSILVLFILLVIISRTLLV